MAGKDEIQELFNQEFPHSKIVVESIEKGKASIKVGVTDKDLRPGGTVSGPFMMAAADAALYAAIFGELGLIVMAVTTNLNINFFNKPAAHRDIVARCKLLKVGRQLVVGEVFLYSDGEGTPVAHAVGTYSIPSIPGR